MAISIQPAGTVFNPPLQITFPNVDGFPPGSKAIIVSFDHGQGRYIPVGEATVSDDGTVISSDPGNGVIAGAWHAMVRPNKPPCTNVKYGANSSSGRSGTQTTCAKGHCDHGTLPTPDPIIPGCIAMAGGGGMTMSAVSTGESCEIEFIQAPGTQKSGEAVVLGIGQTMEFTALNKSGNPENDADWKLIIDGEEDENKRATDSATYSYTSSLSDVGKVIIISAQCPLGIKIIRVIIAEVDILIAGLADADESNPPGAKIHINDNFDENQIVTQNLISDYLPNPDTGKYQIVESDIDLKQGTIAITPAGVTGRLDWTISPGVHVYMQAGGEWVEVSDDDNYVTSEGEVEVLIEGSDILEGSVKASFTPTNAPTPSEDEVAYTVFTGLKITDSFASTTQGHIASSSGYQIVSNASGDIWLTGAAQNIQQWQSSFRIYLLGIMVDDDQTVIGTENLYEIIFGSFDLQKIDSMDMNAVPEDQQRGAILVHELIEQYEKQVNGKDFPNAHASGISAELNVNGATSRTDNTTQPDPMTFHFETIYTPSPILEFDVISGQATVQNVTVSR